MKYKPTAILGEMSGSLDDATFSTGRAGPYIRKRVDPAQPRTAAQNATRNNFRTLSAKWRTLTDAQRAAWRNLATTVTLTGSYGNLYHPTGQQLYVGNNMTLSVVNQVIDDAPGTNSAPAAAPPGQFQAQRGPTAPQDLITLVVGPVPAGQKAVVLATPQFSAGQESVSDNAFRVLQTFGPIPQQNQTLRDAYVAKYGRPVIGMKIAVRVYLFSLASGSRSAALETRTTVVAL